jgi:integrase
MILEAFRHGLRVSELIGWLWDQLDLEEGTVYIRRKKGSKSGMHTLEDDEIRALKRLTPNARDRVGFVFRTERGGCLTENGFHKIVARAGQEAGIGFPVHPHQLRHACGFEMNRMGKTTRLIQDWLGHRNIRHTERYTQHDASEFKRARMWSRTRGRSEDED